MKTRFNRAFLEKQIDKVEALPPNISDIIHAGFEKCGDVVFFKKLAAPTIDTIEFLLKENIDLTGVECYLNKVHLGDLFNSNNVYNHIEIITNGIILAGHAAIAISKLFPGEPFRFILTEDEGEISSVVLRFHKIRANESWVSTDIESYNNGVYILDTE